MSKKKKSDWEESLDQVEKDTGMHISFIEGKEGENSSNVEIIPTPSLSLNYELGAGGLPRGRIVEIFGPQSGGKSTLSQLMVAEEQQRGNNALYVDPENSLEKNYAEQLGVDVSKLAYAQPDYAEQMFKAMEDMLDEKLFSIIVVDSVTALLPKKEFDAEIEDDHYAPLAQVLSKALRRLSKRISNSNTTVIFINQLRTNIGKTWGNPEKTPGGRALKFYSSIRLRVNIKSGGHIEDETGRVIGHTISAKVKKNKVGPPMGETEFDLYYGEGVDQAKEIFEFGKRKGLVFKDGHTYYYGNKEEYYKCEDEDKDDGDEDAWEKIEVGEDSTIEKLRDDKKMFKKVRKKVLGEEDE